MTPACEGCPEAATTTNDTGIPLCARCFAALAAEPAPAIHGHNRGFADGVNDAAPGLLEAARAVLRTPGTPALEALRQAVDLAASGELAG